LQENGAQLGDAHGAIHLGVAAAGDVEVETLVIGGDCLGAERTLGGPARLDGAEAREAPLAPGASRAMAAAVARHLDDGVR
jgi:hypothetical protein